MKDTILVIMTAGTGSRFGGGIKQLKSVGPGGEIIMDYSTHGVMEAGFNKVIFIIRRDLGKNFKEVIGHRIEKLLPVEYAYQELQNLLIGYEVTFGGIKPQGTGQVVPSMKDTVSGSFLVINVDDYYGREGFRRIHNYMTEHMDSQSEICSTCMGGFALLNILSDSGTITRGVCQVDGDGFLTNVTGTYSIQVKEGGLHATDESGTLVIISSSQPVSMNMWGLPASFIQELEKGFPVSLDSLKEEDIKSEYLLLKIIDSPIQNRKTRVAVLNTPNKWFGVTYREGKQAMTDTTRGLIESGVYGKKLLGQGVSWPKT